VPPVVEGRPPALDCLQHVRGDSGVVDVTADLAYLLQLKVGITIFKILCKLLLMRKEMLKTKEKRSLINDIEF